MTKKLMKSAKDTMKVGMGTMGGHLAIGAMSSIPGMPAQAAGSANIAHAGLNLVNVGQLAKTSMSMIESISPSKKRKK